MCAEEREPRPEGDLATGTLAEIYAEQGLYERALAIYERIALRAPHDEAIAERISSLTLRMERARAGEESIPPEPPASEEPIALQAGRDDEFQAWLDSR
ncbi:hypothetical protein BH18GEM1_BH18GEM1_01740 [soil metagenome]